MVAGEKKRTGVGDKPGTGVREGGPEIEVMTDSSGCPPVASKHSRTLLAGLLLAALVAGCSYFVSWDDISQPLIGHPFYEITKFESWQHPDEIKELPNGDQEYKYWLKKLDPSCVHYWIVDPQGIIRGYHYEGRCRPIG